MAFYGMKIISIPLCWRDNLEGELVCWVLEFSRFWELGCRVPTWVPSPGQKGAKCDAITTSNHMDLDVDVIPQPLVYRESRAVKNSQESDPLNLTRSFLASPQFLVLTKVQILGSLAAKLL